MLNDTRPSGYEINNNSDGSGAERNYLASSEFSPIPRRPKSAEIIAALAVVPSMADANRAAPARVRSHKNLRAEPLVPGTGAKDAGRKLRPRPLALAPRRSKKPLLLKALTVPLMGVRVNCITERQVTTHVISSIRAGIGGWIATPNVDHLRIISEQPDLLRMVNEASLRVADGMPLVWASKLQGMPLPERITGAGLALSLATAAARAGKSIFLLGGDPGDAEAAAAVLKRLNPDLKIAGIASPPAGFEHDSLQMTEIGNALHSTRPDLVYSCFGFPKQELVICALRDRVPSAWFLGLGGSLAIVSGRTRRAPGWMQNVGMEWAWRLGLEPRRLFHRYIVRDLPFVFRLFGNALIQH